MTSEVEQGARVTAWRWTRSPGVPTRGGAKPAGGGSPAMSPGGPPGTATGEGPRGKQHGTRGTYLRGGQDESHNVSQAPNTERPLAKAAPRPSLRLHQGACPCALGLGGLTSLVPSFQGSRQLSKGLRETPPAHRLTGFPALTAPCCPGRALPGASASASACSLRVPRVAAPLLPQTALSPPTKDFSIPHPCPASVMPFGLGRRVLWMDGFSGDLKLTPLDTDALGKISHCQREPFSPARRPSAASKCQQASLRLPCGRACFSGCPRWVSTRSGLVACIG